MVKHIIGSVLCTVIVLGALLQVGKLTSKAGEPTQAAKSEAAKKWAYGPGYEAFAENFGRQFVDSFVKSARAKGSKAIPSKELGQEMARRAWRETIKFHFSDLSEKELDQLLLNEEDDRWLKLVATPPELIKKWEEISLDAGRLIASNPSKYITLDK